MCIDTRYVHETPWHFPVLWNYLDECEWMLIQPEEIRLEPVHHHEDMWKGLDIC